MLLEFISSMEYLIITLERHTKQLQSYGRHAQHFVTPSAGNRKNITSQENKEQRVTLSLITQFQNVSIVIINNSDDGRQASQAVEQVQSPYCLVILQRSPIQRQLHEINPPSHHPTMTRDFPPQLQNRRFPAYVSPQEKSIACLNGGTFTFRTITTISRKKYFDEFLELPCRRDPGAFLTYPIQRKQNFKTRR